MNNLPLEIVSLIVQHVKHKDLYQCTLVNMSFYLATQPLLWRVRIIRNNTTLLSFIRTLVNANYELPQQQQQLQLLPTGRFIRRLYLSSYSLTDIHLDVLTEHIGPQLESITIEKGQRITDIGFEKLAQRWPNLTSIDLSHAPITRRSIEALGRYNHQTLNRLLLDNCPRLPPTLFGLLFNCPLSLAMIKYCIGQEYLRRQGSTLELKNFRLDTTATPVFITHVLTTTVNQMALWRDTLTCLILTGSCGPDARRNLIPFIETHPGLKELELREASLTDVTLDAIHTHLPDVRKLIVSSNPALTSQGIRRVVWHCRSLTMLSFKWCGMTAEQFPELVISAKTKDDFNQVSVQRRPNFAALGRRKIQTIRQHSFINGNRR